MKTIKINILEWKDIKKWFWDKFCYPRRKQVAEWITYNSCLTRSLVKKILLKYNGADLRKDNYVLLGKALIEWDVEYPHKADMKPSKCMVDGCKLYNRIGIHCEELEIALQDEGWRLCPTVSEGCPNFEPWPEYKEDIDSILRGCV